MKPPSDPAAFDPKGLTYASYLQVDGLLKLQKPLSETKAHDELLFIVIHQVYELWFKLVLFELEAVAQKLSEGDMTRTYRGLERVREIFRVLVQQVDILETMTPVAFNQFRSKLNPASGFQSRQFRELELMCGADAADYEKFRKLEPEWQAVLDARATGLTLRSGFEAMLRNLQFFHKGDEGLEAAILRVYASDHASAQAVCEGLLGLDEQILLWRFRHVQMVERMIGRKGGTGGSMGVAYLESTLKKRFFPELWAARTSMGPSY